MTMGALLSIEKEKKQMEFPVSPCVEQCPEFVESLSTGHTMVSFPFSFCFVFS